MTRCRERRAVLAIPLAAALAACATGPAPSRTAMPERAAAYAHPEPDPACRGTVQESLAANGLERVVVKLERAPDGGVKVVEFLSPDVTPAARVELARAFGACAWTAGPADRSPPAPEIWTDTIERR